jgi:hypothetical protein
LIALNPLEYTVFNETSPTLGQFEELKPPHRFESNICNVFGLASTSSLIAFEKILGLSP